MCTHAVTHTRAYRVNGHALQDVVEELHLLCLGEHVVAIRWLDLVQHSAGKHHHLHTHKTLGKKKIRTIVFAGLFRVETN